MKKLMRFYISAIFIFCFGVQGYGQSDKMSNLIKISKAYLEFRFAKTKRLAHTYKDKVLIVGANSINKDSLWFELYLADKHDLYDFKYSKIYKLDSIKLVIIEELDKSTILMQLFKEIPYENINKATIKVMIENHSGWRATVNKNYEIVSVESIYRFKDVVEVLKKKKVRFAKNFHFIQNYSWQKEKD